MERGDDGRVPDPGHRAARCGRTGAADRVRQHREPAAGPVRHARPAKSRCVARSGPGRRGIARQLLTESLLLAAMGALLGGRAWPRLLIGPARSPPDEVWDAGHHPDHQRQRPAVYPVAGRPGRHGLRPGARVACRPGRQSDVLTPDGGRSTTGRHGRHLRHAFTVLEVALALVLLAGAGVLVRGFARLRASTRDSTGSGSSRCGSRCRGSDTTGLGRDLLRGSRDPPEGVPGVTRAAASDPVPARQRLHRRGRSGEDRHPRPTTPGNRRHQRHRAVLRDHGVHDAPGARLRGHGP